MAGARTEDRPAEPLEVAVMKVSESFDSNVKVRF
jgi:hypothetical protein